MTEPLATPLHIAGAYRRPTGWIRWYAACTCGFRVDAKGRENAQLLAHLHELEQQAVQP